MYPESLRKLIEYFRLLPGVGEKTAERYALQIIEMDEETVQNFASSLKEIKTTLRHCSICGNLTDSDTCDICADHNRNSKQILVVATTKDVIAMEKTGEFNGVYHVLNGLISTSKGIMPDDLNLSSLIDRAAEAEEVILATNATMDGETTAMYLDKVLSGLYPTLLVTRIAHGLPAGGLLDYADEMTLTHALFDRRKM